MSLAPKLVAVLGLALSLPACGSDDGTMPEEVRLLKDYLAERPELPKEHGTWHGEHLPGLQNYGELFLAMHGHMAMAYDDWRVARGAEVVPAWDPALPIPPSAPHPGRTTDNPAATCPSCPMASWFTAEGGDRVDPHSGARRLADFKSADQLGRSIDGPGTPAWHSSVHGAIGGDMSDYSTAPRDPVFWQFHRTIDNIFRNWLQIQGKPYPPGTHSQ